MPGIRALALAVIVPLTVAAAATQAAPTKHSNGGFSFYVDKEPAWVDEAGAASPTSPGPGWQFRLRDRQVLLDESDQAYTRSVRRVVDSSGLAEASRYELVFNPEFEKLTLHSITVVRDGKRLQRLDPKDVKLLRREKELERGVYDGTVTASIVLADVRAGDDIDLRYTLSGSNPVFQKRFSTFLFHSTEKAPTGLFRFRLMHSRARDIRVEPGDMQVSEMPGSQRLRERVFSRRDIPAWAFLPDEPPASAIPEIAQVSEYADWHAVGAWGIQLFKARPGAVVRDVAASIRAKAGDDPKAQVLAALDFVQREVRYFSVALGESSHLPSPPDKVLQQRYGDCKDKSLLLVSLLGELGIPAVPVLVSQSFRGAVLKMMASPANFDHAMVAVTTGGGTMWLDPTRNRQGGTLEEREVSTYGAGLVLREGVSALERSSRTNADLAVVDVVDVFKFESLAKPVALASTITYRGETAERYRMLIDATQAGRVNDVLFDFIGRRFAGMGLHSDGEVETKDDGGAISLTRRFTVDEPLEYPDQKILLFEHGPWTIFESLRSVMDPGRKRPLFLGGPTRERHRTRVEFGEPLLDDTRETNEAFEDKSFRIDVRRTYAPTVTEQVTTLDYKVEAIEAADLSTSGEKARAFTQKGTLQLGLPTISKERASAIKERLTSYQKGKLPANLRDLTEVQARSLFEDELLTGQLEQGRLSPKHQVTALKHRAFARDYLDRSEQGLADLQEALRLKPDDYEATAEYAEVLFAMGRFDEALKVLDALPESARSGGSYFQKRGRVRYYLGRYADALEDFTTQAREAAAKERLFVALWIHVTATRTGADPSALTRPLVRESSDEWPVPIVQYLLGERSESDLEKAAVAVTSPSAQRSRQCEASFYIGLKNQAQGNEAAARRAFERARSTKVYEYVEYRASGFELARMGAR